MMVTLTIELDSWEMKGSTLRSALTSCASHVTKLILICGLASIITFSTVQYTMSITARERMSVKTYLRATTANRNSFIVSVIIEFNY